LMSWIVEKATAIKCAEDNRTTESRAERLENPGATLLGSNIFKAYYKKLAVAVELFRLERYRQMVHSAFKLGANGQLSFMENFHHSLVVKQHVGRKSF